MTMYNKIIRKLAQKEGKKSQVKVGDLREIMGIFADLFWEDPEKMTDFLCELGVKREKKRGKK